MLAEIRRRKQRVAKDAPTGEADAEVFVHHARSWQFACRAREDCGRSCRFDDVIARVRDIAALSGNSPPRGTGSGPTLHSQTCLCGRGNARSVFGF